MSHDARPRQDGRRVEPESIYICNLIEGSSYVKEAT